MYPDANACAPSAKLKTPVAWYVRHEADRDERVGAPGRDAGEREPEELLHVSSVLPWSCLPARRAQEGVGVPAGSGYTGPLFGFSDWKQTIMFFP